MNRRDFLLRGAAALSATAASPVPVDGRVHVAERDDPTELRSLFPWLDRETYINAARGTPLGAFGSEAIERYQTLCQLGYGDGRGDHFREVMREIRGRFGRLIGAKATEIALVQCTKAGEQIVLDGLPGLRAGGNVVTNDFHFARSLHNLVGLRRTGIDVRIVRGVDWDVDPEAMREAIDDKTALVAVTLVSDVNGRVEPIRELADQAHAHGALVYADIIQAAGIVPIDVRAMGIDFAACSGYKWLFGLHGAGFLFVREEHQGRALEDRLFPGQLDRNYPPWTEEAPADDPGLVGFEAPTDARRYEPGHLAYLGFCALYEGLGLVERVGVETLLGHSVALNTRLLGRIDLDRYPCVSPDRERSPIVTFQCRDPEGLRRRLDEAKIAVTVRGNLVRVSPALYNRAEDMDRLAEVFATTAT